MSASRLIHNLRALLDVDLTGVADGDVLTYRAVDQKIVPGTGGGEGSSGSATVIEDPVTGYAARPATDGAVLWIGWSDPTSLMVQYDIFIAVPNPA